ncbi:hypothetical protein J27TS8_17420 [Robertmurraya siralis]|uniref:Uncharacterized protein n=1 Tax=Robertmurraya siralis TaxID=77777 RepID=A0A919WH91_9BACI|nr:hypothetical protein J27TS8_17420 [Robertmurraya siralis]
MSECKLDHTIEDVRNKYEAQSTYLPKEFAPLFVQFFNEDLSVI